MTSFYTRRGDDGTTGLLGEGRVEKFDLRMEVLGAIDEATAALGLARAHSSSGEVKVLVLQVQRDLYSLMAEAAATAENAEKFKKIDDSKIKWLEKVTDDISKKVTIPREFIVPGDTVVGAFFDMARTIVRRSERKMAELLHKNEVGNADLLRYLNRLSSLLFVIELFENQNEGNLNVTKAKE